MLLVPRVLYSRVLTLPGLTVCSAHMWTEGFSPSISTEEHLMFVSSLSGHCISTYEFPQPLAAICISPDLFGTHPGWPTPINIAQYKTHARSMVSPFPMFGWDIWFPVGRYAFASMWISVTWQNYLACKRYDVSTHFTYGMYYYFAPGVLCRAKRGYNDGDNPESAGGSTP